MDLRHAVFGQLRLELLQTREAEEEIALENVAVAPYNMQTESTPSISCHRCQAEIFSYFALEPTGGKMVEQQVSQLKANPMAKSAMQPLMTVSLQLVGSDSVSPTEEDDASDSSETSSMRSSLDVRQRAPPTAVSAHTPPRKRASRAVDKDDRAAGMLPLPTTVAPLCLACRDALLAETFFRREPFPPWTARLLSIYTSAELEPLLRLRHEALKGDGGGVACGREVRLAFGRDGTMVSFRCA
jgi:hypothetical protein